MSAIRVDYGAARHQVARSDRARGYFNMATGAVCLIFPGPRPRRLGTDYRRGAGLIFHDFGIRWQGTRPRRLGTDYRPAVLRRPPHVGPLQTHFFQKLIICVRIRCGGVLHTGAPGVSYSLGTFSTFAAYGSQGA